MSNTRAGTVIRCDTTALFEDAIRIKSLKYIGNTSGTAEVRADGASGNLVWQAAGANTLETDVVCIHSGGGVHVTVTNGAIVYLYLE